MRKFEGKRIERVTKKKRKTWIIRVVIFLFIIALGTATYAAAQFLGGHDELEKSKLRQNKIDLNKDPFAILLIGSDARKENTHNWRPDVMMVAAVNPKKKTIKLISIPRDTYVEIANTNGGKSKINSSAHYGYTNGVDPITNTRETVENFLHIPIDYYAKVNFKGFMNAVDILGGVDVVSKLDFTTTTFGGGKLQFKKGPQHLDGEHALAYARMRKKDPRGDLGRNERQQEVLNQIVDNLVSVQGITKFTQLTQKIGENFSYSFTLSEIPSLTAIYKSVPKKNITTINIKIVDDRKDGQAVVICSDEEQARISKILQNQLEWTPPSNHKLSVNKTKE